MPAVPERQASPPRRKWRIRAEAASAPGNGEGAHEATVRDHPAPCPYAAFPTGRAGPPSLPRRATRPTRPFRLSPFPQQRRAAPRRDRRPPSAGGRT